MKTRAAAMDLGVSEFVAQPTNNQDLLNRVQLQLRTLEWDKTADQALLKNGRIGARSRAQQVMRPAVIAEVLLHRVQNPNRS
jgi:DNA-binding response OmpR family regulator